MIIHVYSYWEDKESERRTSIAKKTWEATYIQEGWIPCPVLDETLPRLFNEGKRKLPYVKDLVNEATKMPGDYICITNSDTCFAPSLHKRFSELPKGNLLHGNRKDFVRVNSPLSQDQVNNCPNNYPGIDIFLFPKAWWLMEAQGLPDMLLGREAWDAILAQAMAFSGSTCEPNLIYHEQHDSVWQQGGSRYSLPGQLHNISLASEWLRSKNIDPRKFGIRDIPAIWDRPLPPTTETPPGEWRAVVNGVYAKSYCFEVVFRTIKQGLQKSNIEVPKNLKEIIIKQSYCL